MGELTLLSDYCLDTTVLSNIYIDEYMAQNNEAQIKIYLYLLRNLSSGKGVSVSSIADFFNYTVQDVERALKYMQKQGLMKLEISESDNIRGIRILPLTKKEVIVFKQKPEITKEQISDFAKRPEIKELLFVAEQYIGNTISPEDIQSLYYINNTLGLNEEVIEYLIEYSVGLKKKSFSFMKKVAEDWADAGVTCVKDAKKLTYDCPKEIHDIFAAFGIKGTNRKPQPAEIKYAKLWIREYGYSMDIIEKACIRTVEKTHSVSFEYADAILNDWKVKGVKHLADVEKLDDEFLKQRAAKELSRTKASKKESANNKFNGFSQREYDFEELERELLRK
ncbi:MAG: DnaD domain protein [Lachnospiraceae bacterium]|nr:DnaD domain protein [Lachnospiraceae bacterium]